MRRGHEDADDAEGPALLEPETLIPLAVMAALGGLLALRVVGGWGG